MTIHIFVHWMIVVRNGQVFKYCQKVFKYQHRYLGIYYFVCKYCSWGICYNTDPTASLHRVHFCWVVCDS